MAECFLCHPCYYIQSQSLEDLRNQKKSNEVSKPADRKDSNISATANVKRTVISNTTTESLPRDGKYQPFDSRFNSVFEEHAEKDDTDEFERMEDLLQTIKYRSMTSNQSETETVDGVKQSTATPSDIVRIKTMDLTKRRATRDDDFESVRIVLLGCCNSGKSTFVKQVRNVYLKGISSTSSSNRVSLGKSNTGQQEIQTTAELQDESELYRHLIVNNTLQCFKQILAYMKKNDPHFIEGGYEVYRNLFAQIFDSNSINIAEDDNESLILACKNLGSDLGFISGMNKGSEYNLMETAKYLVDNSHRIFAFNYTPSEEDVLMSRNSTVAISTDIIKVPNDLPIKIQDFGGYRFQRLRWHSYFTATIDACVFVHSLACYDLNVEEEPEVNQFKESLQVFDMICNDDLLSNLPLILILNKKDLLEEKLKRKPFAESWPDYPASSPNDTENVVQYVKEQFQALNKQKTNRPFYVYETTAIRKDQSIAMIKMVVSIAQKHHKGLQEKP